MPGILSKAAFPSARRETLTWMLGKCIKSNILTRQSLDILATEWRVPSSEPIQEIVNATSTLAMIGTVSVFMLFPWFWALIFSMPYLTYSTLQNVATRKSNKYKNILGRLLFDIRRHNALHDNISRYYLNRLSSLQDLRVRLELPHLVNNLTNQELNFNTSISRNIIKTVQAMQCLTMLLKTPPQRVVNPIKNIQGFDFFDCAVLGQNTVDELVAPMEEYFEMFKEYVNYFLLSIIVYMQDLASLEFKFFVYEEIGKLQVLMEEGIHGVKLEFTEVYEVTTPKDAYHPTGDLSDGDLSS